MFREKTLNEIPQIKSDTDFNRYCNEDVALCMILVISNTSLSFQQDLNLFGNMAEVRKNDPVSFYWIASEICDNLLKEFVISKKELPCVIAFSGKKMRYAVFKKAITVDSLNDYFTRVLSGREYTQPIQVIYPFEYLDLFFKK